MLEYHAGKRLSNKGQAGTEAEARAIRAHELLYFGRLFVVRMREAGSGRIRKWPARIILMDSEKPSQFDNLPVEGWFWELVRRDARFRKRFAQMEEAVQAHAASRLTDDDYGRALKNYLAHLRRYGIETFSLPGPEDRKNLAALGFYLILPQPGKEQLLAVPRPDVPYTGFGHGPKPTPRKVDMPEKVFDRDRIRKLLAKYDLLEKK